MVLVTAQRDILDRGPRVLARHIVELVLSSHNKRQVWPCK
jgi:hypothetical protein